MAELIAEAGANISIYKVHVDEIQEQDLNARVMPPEMLERLTANIRREGRLEQLLFCVKRADDVFELISGHHRLRAFRAAGLTELFVLADERELDRSQVRAKQIAHNRISGTDDQQTLKQMWTEIERIDDVLESYISEDDFNDIKQLDPVKLTTVEVVFPWRYVGLVFLAETLLKLEEVELLVSKVPKNTDVIGVIPLQQFEQFRDVARNLGRTDDIRNIGAIMSRMIEITEAYIEEHTPQAVDEAEAGA